MIIWRGAIARTGGTVCSEVVNALLQAAGYQPKKLTAEQLLANRDGDGQPCLGSDDIYVGAHDGWHDPVLAQPDLRVFYIWRDIKQSMASMRRFTHCEFDLIQKNMALYYDHAAFFQALSPTICLQLSYSQDVLNMERLAFRLAGFLALPVKAETIRAIAEQFDRHALQKQLKKMEAAITAEMQAAWSQPGDKTVTLMIRSDPGLQRYHIPGSSFDIASQKKLQTGGFGNYYLTLPSGMEIALIGNNDGNGFRISHFDTADDQGVDRENLPMRLQVGHITQTTDDDWTAQFNETEIAWIEEHAKRWSDLYGDRF